MVIRCAWAGTDPLYVAYHDEEWGVPVHDDQKLFEFLILEGAQAGLSWSTILRKRQNYRAAFDQECESLPRNSKRVRQLRPVHMAICEWTCHPKPMENNV
jgi:DNA-3-methyladenine glycosylase I